MRCTKVDMETYRRKDHFAYFSGLAYPYVGVTVNVEITGLRRAAKAHGWPFFLTLCYAVSHAANAVPEFRQRMAGGGIVEFDWCPTSHTVALDDGTYGYCALDSRRPFGEYLPYAVRAQEAARRRGTIVEEADGALGCLFISTLPWLSYTSLIQPVPMPADSNPRLTWGKFFEQDGRVLLPLSVLCHHELEDGVHIARFYERLDAEIARLCGAP